MNFAFLKTYLNTFLEFDWQNLLKGIFGTIAKIPRYIKNTKRINEEFSDDVTQNTLVKYERCSKRTDGYSAR